MCPNYPTVYASDLPFGFLNNGNQGVTTASFSLGVKEGRVSDGSLHAVLEEPDVKCDIKFKCK